MIAGLPVEIESIDAESREVIRVDGAVGRITLLVSHAGVPTLDFADTAMAVVAFPDGLATIGIEKIDEGASLH